MRLSDLLAQIDSLDDELVIYAEKNPNWSPNSHAAVLPEPEDGRITEQLQGMTYLLEVFLAKEVLEVWSNWRNGNNPNLNEKCEAIIYYAEHDAYLPI